MVITIIIAFLSLIVLVILHELGHFILAKRLGVKVEEFGIGFPPRLWSKKIGETVYSLNLLPFGAFVRMYGEEENIKKSQSFTGKPIWQRALIVIGGCVAFWIIAAILLSIVFGIGAPIAVADEENGDLISPKVQIVAIAAESPAYKAGLKQGDTIIKVKSQKSRVKSIDKVWQIQNFTEEHKGEEIVLTIQRREEVFDISLVPRVDPPEQEGRMGLALARTVIKDYPWHEAIVQGILATGRFTALIINVFGQIIGNLARGEPLPPGVGVIGPVGIFGLMEQRVQLGAVYFLQFIAIITIHLALINLLPIPALDGGKLVFLGIEAIRKKPVSPEIEKKVTMAFFSLLIMLMIWITIKDIIRLF